MKKRADLFKVGFTLLSLFIILLFIFVFSLNLVSAQQYSVNVSVEHPFLLANETYIPANQLKIGDKIITPNLKKAIIKNIINPSYYNNFVSANVTNLFEFLRNDYFIIKTNYSNSEIKVTGEHPFFVNNSWVLVKDLKVGDELYIDTGETAKITEITQVHTLNSFEVFNLEVDDPHDYFAEDILVHNKPQVTTDPAVLEEARQGALADQDALDYAKLTIQLGISRANIEDVPLFEKGQAEMSYNNNKNPPVNPVYVAAGKTPRYYFSKPSEVIYVPTYKDQLATCVRILGKTEVETVLGRKIPTNPKYFDGFYLTPDERTRLYSAYFNIMDVQPYPYPGKVRAK